MKALVTDYNGGLTVSIRATPRFNTGRRFDQWQSHAAGLLSIGLGRGVSGLWFPTISGNLKDGNYWNWFTADGFDYDTAQSIIDASNFFQVPGYPGNWEGEGFNHLLRHQLTVKVIQAGIPAWIASH